MNMTALKNRLNMGIYGKISLILILKKQAVRISTGYILLRVYASGGLL
jgi:hypothetical protein